MNNLVAPVYGVWVKRNNGERRELLRDTEGVICSPYFSLIRDYSEWCLGADKTVERFRVVDLSAVKGLEKESLHEFTRVMASTYAL